MSQNYDRLDHTFKVLILSFSLILSFFMGAQCSEKRLLKGIEERVDTLFVHDTITHYEPIKEERIVIRKEFVPVVQQDTIWQHETLYVALDREQVIWQDSLARVYASGINPKIDSVQHYISERVIYKEIVVPKVKKTRWGIGVHAGYGVQFGKEITAAPYVGVGVSYNILTW